MDTLSHGLWSSLALGRKDRRAFWIAFFFGVAPDLFSFGPFFFERFAVHGLEMFQGFEGKPDPSMIPRYVYELYDFTHSLVVFAVVFAIVWALLKRPYWLMGGWALHILLDIFTHSDEFFPTPFLWPISSYHFDGISWGHPAIFIPNVFLLAVVSGYVFFKKRKRHDRAS